MRNLDDLAIRDGKPASATAVDHIERVTGRSLPPMLREIVMKHDGGSPDVGVFDFDGQTTAISELLRFNDPDEPLGILFTLRNHAGIPQDLIPFARDAGGWLIALDYRTSLVPGVVVFEPEAALVHPAFQSFEAFVEALYGG